MISRGGRDRNPQPSARWWVLSSGLTLPDARCLESSRQRRQFALVMPPDRDGAGVDRAPYLRGARSRDWRGIFVELEALRLPFQMQRIEQVAHGPRGIRHQL